MLTIAIAWENPVQGTVEIVNGRLVGLAVTDGDGDVAADRFAFRGGPCRLEIAIDEERMGWDADPTFVTIHAAEDTFTVLLRDVSAAYPIWLPMYGTAVTAAADRRSYAEIAGQIQARGLHTVLRRLEAEPEESYATAAATTYPLQCATWLGLSRDMRIFSVAQNIRFYNRFEIQPQFHSPHVTLPEADGAAVNYACCLGRGVGAVRQVSRRLDDGILPILHTTLTDEDITYTATAFVTLECSPLTLSTLRGTHFLAADGNGCGNMLTEEQTAHFREIEPTERNRDEETVLYYRVRAVNTAAVPRYAWFKAPEPNVAGQGFAPDGLGRLQGGRVYAVASLNGTPLPKDEVAVLLKPGEAALFEFKLPHQPISATRAAALGGQDFTQRLEECRRFWREKLARVAQVHLPEARVDEMLHAGLLHLDLVAYGQEPNEPVAATIGVYCPIGSESAPIIQFIDSMGDHALARRALQYFLEKQHDDGFIQNFGGYMLETGPALWSLGEHYRYTRDDAWVRTIAPKLLKACDFLLQWRGRNLREDLRGHGYGLMEGKVADPEDPFRTFMLNGYAYLGMSRVAEMLAGVDPQQARRIAGEAAALKADIRVALEENMAQSPAVPLADGSWCPTIGPWAEARGPVSLCTDRNNWYTHGAFVGRDSMIGPLYLILTEVLDPSEPLADLLLNYSVDLWHERNVAFSQPYYSPHPRFHLQRGEVPAFLKAYYNTFAGLADRETYTFWEHFFGASPHKTHEEGWFLMQTRWMLYLEDGDTLKLLPGIPRAWLQAGQSLELSGVASYFGPLSLYVTVAPDHRTLQAEITCDSARKPARVELRLPHPQHRHPSAVEGGQYDPTREIVLLDPFPGRVNVTLTY